MSSPVNRPVVTSVIKPQPITRVYLIISDSQLGGASGRLCRLGSGIKSKAFDYDFDVQAMDMTKTIVMITEEEAREIVVLFALIEMRLSESQTLEPEK